MRRKPGETRALLLQFLTAHHLIFGRMPTAKNTCARLQIGYPALITHLKHLERSGAIIVPPRGTLNVSLNRERANERAA